MSQVKCSNTLEENSKLYQARKHSTHSTGNEDFIAGNKTDSLWIFCLQAFCFSLWRELYVKHEVVDAESKIRRDQALQQPVVQVGLRTLISHQHVQVWPGSKLANRYMHNWQTNFTGCIRKTNHMNLRELWIITQSDSFDLSWSVRALIDIYLLLTTQL